MQEEDLKVYYNYLYPFTTLVKWLTYNYSSNLMHRELSFEYEGVGVERYVTFENAKSFKERMLSRDKKVPLKIDAGAIWNQIPQKDAGPNAKTIERELIFDFDMNDYDDVRTCCEGKKVCVKCWKLLIVAVEILEKALEEDFDFHKMMLVFSGGRGLHIWVCDKKARLLKDSVRKSIVDYLQLVTGNDKAASLLAQRVISPVEEQSQWKIKGLTNENREYLKAEVIKNYMPYHVERSLNILKTHQMDIFNEQNILAHQKCRNIIYKILEHRNQKLRDRVRKRWEEAKDQSTQNLLKEMTDEVELYETTLNDSQYPVKDTNQIRKFKRITFIEEEIMLSFLYPRMDFNVSTMQNHLLKLPFSVHPKSNKVSIPLFKRQLKTFNPENCVTHKQLMALLQQYQTEGIDYD